MAYHKSISFTLAYTFIKYQVTSSETSILDLHTSKRNKHLFFSPHITIFMCK